MDRLERTLDLVERVAAAIAKSHGHDFHERCALKEFPAGYCDSDTCVAAWHEDHDAPLARDQYRKDARAALSAITRADLGAL